MVAADPTPYPQATQTKCMRGAQADQRPHVMSTEGKSPRMVPTGPISPLR